MTEETASYNLALVIREEYPNEQLADELAEQLAAWAIAKREGLDIVLAWLRDRPRHPLSMAHLADWTRRYNLA
jgi:hypothetical protein